MGCKTVNAEKKKGRKERAEEVKEELQSVKKRMMMMDKGE